MTTEEKLLNQSACNFMKENETIDEMKLLEHIGSCDICAASYAEQIEKNEMLKAPHYMKINILQKSKNINDEEKIVRFKKKDYSKQFQLFRYSMKVGVAMCGALAMLFLTSLGGYSSNHQNEPIGSIEQEDKEYTISIFINQINFGLRDLSNNIIQYTNTIIISNNDKEEKK